MSQVPVFVSSGLGQGPLEELFQGLPEDAQERRQELDRRFGRGLQSLLRRYQTLGAILDREVSLGYPDDGTAVQRPGNVTGGWASALLTGGLGGAVAFAHNLGLPVQPVPGRAYNLANVRWGAVCFTHGDRSGTNGAPAAAANPAHSSLYFRLGDAVTTNSIELRVHSNLTVNAANPLLVEVRFYPAVL